MVDFSLKGLLLSIFSLFYGYDVINSPLAVTPLGSIRGSELADSSRRVLSFRGIPYAEAPVGKLRFQDPVPVSPWQGVFDATNEGPTCIQPDEATGMSKGTEDCLTLNVYTHNLSQKKDELRPVMVWIHGGAFIWGSGNGQDDIYGPHYLLDRDIVLVTINYRLGPFGFLSTEDAEAPGNYGLLDQTLALEWVKDNIVYFGGNPDSITIFGESAGAASVHLQVLSPHSKGLFHRAIAQSGTALCSWVMSDSVGRYTEMVAEHLNCSMASSRDTVDCLRSKSAEEITLTRKIYQFLEMFPVGFGPRVDVERQQPFMPQHPEMMIRQGLFNPVPLITGVVQNEAGFIIAALIGNNGSFMDRYDQDPDTFTRYILSQEFRSEGQEMARSAIDRYLLKRKKPSQQLHAMDRMISDGTFLACADKTVRLHRQFTSSPVYYYYYTHQGEHSFSRYYNIPMTAQLGVCHADELFLLFRSFNLTRKADVAVSNLMLDMWTSFAESGDPKFPGWMPVNGETSYLTISSEPAVVKSDLPFYSRLAFWEKFSVSAANN